MTQMIRTAVVGAIAAALVASVAVAQGPAQGPGRGQGRGPGFGGPGGRGMMPIMRELTDEQRQQVRAILQEQRPEDRAAGPKLHRDLQAELLADAPHEGRIEQLKQQLLEQHAQHLARQIETQTRISRILTPEQRAKARERLSQAPEKPQGRRGADR